MWSTIWSFLSKNYPTLFLILAVGVIVWLVARKWFSLQHEIKDHGNKIEDEGTQIKGCESRIDKLDNVISGIREDIAIIKTHLIEKDSKAAKVFSGKASPRKLNEMGLQVYKEFDGPVFLDKNQDFLFRMIDEKNPQTALDVENASLEVLYKCVENNIFNDVKVLVYNSKAITIQEKGKEPAEYAITMNDICFIFSLELRDRYLAAHPDVRQE